LNHTKLKVGIEDLDGLLNNTNLVIPYFQRPYTWTDKQVGPLLNDLFAADEEMPIIMGGIIFHVNKENKIEIVDGQQRLVTLSIIAQLTGHEFVGSLHSIKFSHQTSKQNIRLNTVFIKKFIDKKGCKQIVRSFANMRFISVYAPSLEEAFSFFDSQNTRGKRLEDYDILKAHHLRYIKDDLLAQDCAVKWEKIEKDKSIGMKLLIETLLARGRKWSRNEYREADVKKEFKSQRVVPVSASRYPINRYQQPPVFDSWKYDPLRKDSMEFIFRPTDATYKVGSIVVNGSEISYLPFQINQAIEGGELFFWYTQKYYQLYQEVVQGKETKRSDYFKALLAALKNFNYNAGSNYVYEIFTGALLFYVDKFGYEMIDKAATYLFFCCYYLRFSKTAVQYNSVYKYIREPSGFNPFSIMQKAGYPDYIFRRCDDFLEGKYNKESLQPGGIRSAIAYGLFYKDAEALFFNFKPMIPEQLSIY